MPRMAGLSAIPVCSLPPISRVHPPGCIVVAKKLYPAGIPTTGFLFSTTFKVFRMISFLMLLLFLLTLIVLHKYGAPLGIGEEEAGFASHPAGWRMPKRYYREESQPDQ